MLDLAIPSVLHAFEHGWSLAGLVERARRSLGTKDGGVGEWLDRTSRDAGPDEEKVKAILYKLLQHHRINQLRSLVSTARTYCTCIRDEAG